MDPKVDPVRLIRCKICDEWFNEGKQHDRSAKHLKNLFLIDEPIKLVESAAQRRLETYFLRNTKEKLLDYEEYLRKSVAPLIEKKIRDTLVMNKSLKVNILVYADYVKAEDIESTDAESQLIKFKTKNIAFFRASEIDEKMNELFESILQESVEFNMKGSGWVLRKIIGTELRINQYDALSRGSSYIPLPIKTHCVVNVQNDDHQCFKYAVLGKHLPQNTINKERTSKYKAFLNKYNFSCVGFPTPIRDIPKFEKANNVSISVFGIDGYDDKEDKNPRREGREDGDFAEIGFGAEDYIQDSEEDDINEDYDGGAAEFLMDEAGEVRRPRKKDTDAKKKKKGKPQIYPLRIAKEEQEDHIDLLYFTKGTKSHYCWISNFEGLVRSQLTKKQQKIYICKKCFSFYYTEKRLIEHKKVCNDISKDAFIHEVPKDPVLKFKSPEKGLPHKYMVICDFESYLREIEFDPERPTYAYQHHTPMSYAYTVVSPDPEINTETPVLYRGPDAHKHFLESMLHLADRISMRFQIEREIRMTEETERAFEATTMCELCDGAFTENNPKVRDHDHQYVDPAKSNYRMALCRNCNLNYKHPKNMTCVFHNLSRYDLHFIVKALNGKKFSVHIIPTTNETYISLTIRTSSNFKIRFIDSYRFLAASLDKLVGTLPEHAFVRTNKLCETPEQLELVKQKAVFCYDYVCDESKLLETQPPPREAFFSQLKQEHISQEDYDRFCRTWDAFDFRNLGEYVDFYLRLDVTLLADVFQEFRAFGLNNYRLDCVNYVTLPSFAFDAFLKMTKVKIELFKDKDMTLMILNNIRGGISQCIQRHAVANNPAIPETYEEKKGTNVFLQYFDATGLYAYTMCKSLPYGGYEWVHPSNLAEIDVLSIPDDAAIGYILEVDLDYPEDIHDLHSDLPFCCENKVPPQKGSRHKKLLTTLESKTEYTIHYVALKQALRNGLVLKRVHRALRFKQRPFLKEFIDINARLRQEAKGNEFHQSLLKLCSNACYGKFLENPLKRKNIKLATNKKQIMGLVSKAEFLDRKIFDEELVAVELARKKVCFDRPGIVGFAILDLSKVHMYRFFYEKMLKIYPKKCINLLYMDTDSFIFEITTEDAYEPIKDNLDVFDTSNYPKEHPCYSDKNYKVMGTFKDETGGDPILEFSGLRAKMYQYSTRSKTDMRAKGVQTSVLKKTVTAEDYLNALYQNTAIFRDMRQFRSEKHEMFTVKTRKKALSSFDDKRLVLQGNVVTLPYGHKALKLRARWSIELKEALDNSDLRKLKSTDSKTGLNLKENLEEIEKQRERRLKLRYLEESMQNNTAKRQRGRASEEGMCSKKSKHS